VITTATSFNQLFNIYWEQ